MGAGCRFVDQSAFLDDHRFLSEQRRIRKRNSGNPKGGLFPCVPILSHDFDRIGYWHRFVLGKCVPLFGKTATFSGFQIANRRQHFNFRARKLMKQVDFQVAAVRQTVGGENGERFQQIRYLFFGRMSADDPSRSMVGADFLRSVVQAANDLHVSRLDLDHSGERRIWLIEIFPAARILALFRQDAVTDFGRSGDLGHSPKSVADRSVVVVEHALFYLERSAVAVQRKRSSEGHAGFATNWADDRYLNPILCDLRVRIFQIQKRSSFPNRFRRQPVFEAAIMKGRVAEAERPEFLRVHDGSR